LSIWESGALAGTLTLSKGMGRRVALLFVQSLEDNVVPVRTHWGGSDVGTVVTVRDSALKLPDETVVVSDYGEVLTIGQVKARRGARRRDGLPTELFGYEDEVERLRAARLAAIRAQCEAVGHSGHYYDFRSENVSWLLDEIDDGDREIARLKADPTEAEIEGARKVGQSFEDVYADTEAIDAALYAFAAARHAAGKEASAGA